MLFNLFPIKLIIMFSTRTIYAVANPICCRLLNRGEKNEYTLQVQSHRRKTIDQPGLPCALQTFYKHDRSCGIAYTVDNSCKYGLETQARESAD